MKNIQNDFENIEFTEVEDDGKTSLVRDHIEVQKSSTPMNKLA